MSDDPYGQALQDPRLREAAEQAALAMFHHQAWSSNATLVRDALEDLIDVRLHQLRQER